MKPSAVHRNWTEALKRLILISAKNRETFVTTVYLSGKPENFIWISNLHLIWVAGTCQLPNMEVRASQWSYELQATTWKWFPTHSFFGFRYASVVFCFSGLTDRSTNNWQIENRNKHGEIRIKTANIGDFMEQNEVIKDTIQQRCW